MKKIDRILELFVPRLMLVTVIALWTLAVSASLVWNVYHSKKTTIELAVNEAIVHFQKDMDFGRWGAKHGGLYVPVSDEVKPSRFLSQLPERDIVTSSGLKLTLVNPVYMLRGFLDKNGTLPGDNTSITLAERAGAAPGASVCASGTAAGGVTIC